MARKKQQKPQEEHVPTIFDHFGMENPGPTHGTVKAAKKDDKSVDYESQITALTKRLDDLSRANVALMSQAPSTTVTAPEQPKSLDLSGMPDPVSDPDKYNAELNKRIEANISSRLNYTQHQTTSAQDQKNKFDSLWTDFESNEQYADIAKHQDRVKFIAGQLVEEAKSRGLDPQRYVLTGREQFFGDLAARYEKTFGKPQTENEPEKDDDKEDDNDDRAASILGGMESGFGSGARAEGKAQLGDMSTDLKDIQRKSGFF